MSGDIASALLPYTSHSIGCAIYQRSWASGEPPCTCGLDDVRSRLTTPSQGLDAATVERVRDAAKAWTAFVTARTRMNEAIPALDASAAERALYDERYKADHEAEREHYRTACQLAQVAGDILAALATDPHQHGGKGA